MACLVALGARSSNHSVGPGLLTPACASAKAPILQAIIGNIFGSTNLPGEARLTPFRVLTDRAYATSAKSGLLSMQTPTLESYEVLIFLKYALTAMVEEHPRYGEVHSTLMRQRAMLLSGPSLDEQSKSKVRGMESVSLLLCDCMHAMQVQADYCRL